MLDYKAEYLKTSTTGCQDNPGFEFYFSGNGGTLNRAPSFFTELINSFVCCNWKQVEILQDAGKGEASLCSGFTWLNQGGIDSLGVEIRPPEGQNLLSPQTTGPCV